MSLILGVCISGHDASACLFDDYDLIAAIPLERITRNKSDGGRFPDEAIDEALSIAGAKRTDVSALTLSRSRFKIRYFTDEGAPLIHRIRRMIENLSGSQREIGVGREISIRGNREIESFFRAEMFLKDNGFDPSIDLSFYDHHAGHVLPTLFYNPEWNDALLYSADGGAETGYYSHRYFHDGQIDTLFGGDEMIGVEQSGSSLALAYGFATAALGYKINRHEGKLTGLAARGKPKHFDQLREWFIVADNGQISSESGSHDDLRQLMVDIAAKSTPEDVSCSVQKLVEEVILESVTKVVAKHPTRNLGLSGGLFANVRLNQVLADSGLFDSIFVCPPMSDQGIALGGCLDHLIKRDGLDTWLKNRRELDSMYYGKDYTGIVDEHFATVDGIEKISDQPVETALQAILDGDAVAIFTGRMEFGPRALGARTVLAATVDSTINDTLNARMDRSEFMPFAPVLLEEHADEVLELPPQSRYTSRFMTITCQVKEEWKERIPAVVHVDGTARPQLIRRKDNHLYYDILSAYHAKTGIPVLVNTSFNVHEEPIINSPAECARALLDDRVDAVVTDNGFYRRKKA